MRIRALHIELLSAAALFLFAYDGEGRIIKTTRYISPSEHQTTVTDYNYLGKLTSVTTKVRAGDIVGNNYKDNSIIDIITTYSYDLNGNLTGITDAAGNLLSTQLNGKIET